MSRLALVALLASTAVAAGMAEEVVVSDAVVKLEREVHLPAGEPGLIQQIHVAEGDFVQQGSVIVTLDDSKLRLEAVAAAREAEVARMASENDVDARFAEKSRAVAEAELNRAREAVRMFEKSVSKSELDQLRLVMERSMLAAEQADRDLQAARLRAELEEARADVIDVRLENMKLKAPFDGIVVQLQKQAGEWLNVGEPVARVIRLDQLRVEGFVDGRKYDRSLSGKPATMTVKLPDGKESMFTGQITFVSAELHPISGLVRVWAEIVNRDSALRPGMRGELKIQH